MIRGRDAKKREGYSDKMTHALDFTSIPLKIGGIRSTSSPWQCLLECCAPCFFSFPLSWRYFTLLIKFHRAIWSPLPRAVSHSVPSFSPHHSSLLIPFAALRVYPMSNLLSSGPSLSFSTTAIFLQPLKELKISQKPHVCTLRSCWTIWLKVFGNGSLKLALNTTFSLPISQKLLSEFYNADTSHFFPPLWLLPKVIMQDSPAYSFLYLSLSAHSISSH